jgi:type II secretory pathway pseudopilin PulG
MSNLIKRLFKSKVLRPVRGDTILEVVIATAILSSIMIATFDILQRALDTNVNVKNRVIALNIAREGIEAVRNVRDTNWLKYSGERRTKWLCLDTTTDSNACNGTPPNTSFINNNFSDDTDEDDAVFYTIDFDNGDSRFYLNRETLNGVIDFEANQPTREAFRLNIAPATAALPERYTHAAPTGSVPSLFYRQIELEIKNPYEVIPVSGHCTGGTCGQARLKVISRVYWQEEGRSRSITLETYLFDFFERNDY